MSATVSGKFQDHYALLGVDVKADSDTIALAYAKYSDKYNPDNPDTGDREKFDKIAIAFEVLSDPSLRREFDKVKGVSLEMGSPKFSGLAFFEALGRGTGLRLALLCVMYDRRRTRPFTPSLSMRHIENILHSTEAELTFALWYLKQRGLVNSDDKSSLQITVEGMDFLEKNRPSPDLVMPFVKATGLAAAAAESHEPHAEHLAEADHVVGPAAESDLDPPAEPPFEPADPMFPPVSKLAEVPRRETESVQNVLRRARARG